MALTPSVAVDENNEPAARVQSAPPFTNLSNNNAAPRRYSTQYSDTAKNVLMSKITLSESQHARPVLSGDISRLHSPASADTASHSSTPSPTEHAPPHDDTMKRPLAHRGATTLGVGAALTDTPAPSVPGSPRMSVSRRHTSAARRNADLPNRPAISRTQSAASTPRMRPTTLDIPGLTKSKVSPDGKIASRDVGSKLVIVMVGLPARGKSYITKKMARYLNWLQHDTRIFNVGERRRVAATGHGYRLSSSSSERRPSAIKHMVSARKQSEAVQAAEAMLQRRTHSLHPLAEFALPESAHEEAVVDAAPIPKVDPIPTVEVTSPGPEVPTPKEGEEKQEEENIDQSASFFDPQNKQAAQLREQCAMDTLDDLLDYILNENGSVGIFDATNSTLARRRQIMKKIRERAGPDLNVLFVESVCQNQSLLESNMRLKLSGPDYEGTDPVAALEDFKKRVAIYEKNYVPIGDYEEQNNMPYVKMIDVGRKMISHQIRGFLAAQAVYYLLNFNLSPRMIWITRHGESEDNVSGKIGGDSHLSPNGRKYAQALTRFIEMQRAQWDIRQAERISNAQLPPAAGDSSPPNPYYGEGEVKHFCVWTSMLQRSIETAQNFNEEDYEIKQMRMLDELNAGHMEGMTYEDIKTQYADEYARRKRDKLAYRYPGPGGEGYLDIINRIRPVIVELERMTDHCLLVTHRSVARVLLAYFQNLNREDVADLDCPLGMLYQLEPRPYGVEFKAWRYNPEIDTFEYIPDYKLHRSGTLNN